MTADELALLRGVEAAPDDDLPRLVYADWLDEHGRHARGEFIRVQCELASIERRLEGMTLAEKRVAGPRRGELKRAQRSAIAAKNPEAIGYYPTLQQDVWRYQSHDYGRKFCKGFLSEFAISEDINEHYEAEIRQCAAMVPRPKVAVWNALRMLTQTQCQGWFTRQSIWSEVDSLHMYDHTNDMVLPHELIPMMHPEYPRLREFSAYMMRLNPGHVCVIAERLKAPHLERINLFNNEIVDSGVAFLHRAIYAKSLREINLCQNPICRPEISKLTKDRFPSLQKLDLSECPVMPQSLAQLRAQLPGVDVIC